MSPTLGRRAIVVMAKQPVAGSTKTRLAPRLTTSGAAELYECFLRDTLDLARSVRDAHHFVAVWPRDAIDWFGTLAPDFEPLPQVGDSLAVRLAGVLSAALAAGFERVLAINSDSPNLPRAHLIAGFDGLDDDRTDAVIGPCEDGGYYLIGWKRPLPEMVTEVEMSTPNVLRDTLVRADVAGLSVQLLPSWYDVDEPVDLDRLVDDLVASPDSAGHSSRFLAATSVEG